MGFTQFIRNNAHWLIAGALLTTGSSFGQTYFISVFAGEIMKTFDLTHGQWGGIYSLGTTASAIVVMWAGTLSDRFRAKTLGSVVFLLLAMACLFLANVRVAWLLPLAIFGLRFAGQGMLSHISVVAMSRWYSANRGKALAISALGFSVGEAVLPLLFVSLLAVIDWRFLWIAAAGIALLLIPVLRTLLRRERTPKSIADASEATGMLGRHWTRRQAVSHWLFWIMLPAFTAPGIFSTSFFFQQVHLTQSKGWDHVAFVAMFPLYTVVTILSMLAYGLAIDRWGSARLLPLYQIPMAAAYLVFSFGNTMTMAAVGFILMGLMHGGMATLANAFWPEYYGTRYLGSIKALAAALMVFGSALGPGVTGALIDLGMPFHKQMLYFAVYILLACGLAYFAMRRVSRADTVTADV